MGFVTAGHVAYAGDSLKYNATGAKIAQCVDSVFCDEDFEAAYCKITNSSYTPSNTLYGTSNVLSTTISEPGVGTVINKIGCTSGHTSGKVVATHVSTKIGDDSYWIYDLTKTTADISEGDSGGVFYSYISSTNTRLTLGIGVAGDDNYSYYSKANLINDYFGLTRY